ncbi:putative xenobiotic compound monooxygenase, DszA family [Stipitochalara longipes BDJ]|nr:putative xenobiotic compound monooxygenase, DszA family [Stipitochalara longipes BDJ]
MVASSPKKQLILNAFVENCSGHQSPGLWRHPDDESSDFNNIHHWIKLAKLLESAKFHGIFIADVLGGYDVYQGPRNLSPAIKSGAQWPVNEPLALVPAMAAATESLGFGVTVATTYEQPYHLACRLSTIDHLTSGRIGWNIVTGYLDSAARNLGATEQPKHDERYAIAEEYLRVMYKLWQASWRDDAVVLNRETGVYSDPQRIREINHVGKYYQVPGPHICQPSPQRTPLLLQAGTLKARKAFASQHAEDIRQQAQDQFGRGPNTIKFLALICPIIGKTEEEAAAKFSELQNSEMLMYDDDQELRHLESNAIRSAVEGWSKASPSVAKWTKTTVVKHITIGGLGATVVGTPAQVADEFESWVEEADVDGFNVAYALKPGTFIDVIELLSPELRKRGLFWDDYLVKAGTCRENISGQVGQKCPPDDHPSARYHCKSGVEKEAHTIPPKPEQETKNSLKRKPDTSPETGRPKRRKSARRPS